MKTLVKRANVQLIAATHSPLIMASLEPLFDEMKDAWLDLDLVKDESTDKTRVELTPRPFIRQGDVARWLLSEAFDLPSTHSVEAEKVIEKASDAMNKGTFDAEKARKIDAALRGVLGDTDPFWMRWRYIAEKRGWIS